MVFESVPDAGRATCAHGTQSASASSGTEDTLLAALGGTGELCTIP